MKFINFILTSSVLTMFTLALSLATFFLNQGNTYVSGGHFLIGGLSDGCLIDEGHLLNRGGHGCILLLLLRQKQQWPSGFVGP